MRVRMWVSCGLFSVGLAALAAVPLGGQDGVGGTVYLGAAVPVGDFADDIGEEAGMATTSLALGGDVWVGIPALRGLQWLSSLNAMYFGVDEDFAVALAGEGIDADIGRYETALIFTGARYAVEVAPMTRLYVLGQIGTGVARAPQGDLTFMGQQLQLTANWVPVWGVSGGVGILLRNRISLDARFGRLTRPELESELKYGGTSEDIQYEQPMAWCRVTLGWRLF